MHLQASPEATFDVLQIGTHRYTNVTLTAHAKTPYVLLMHAGGIINLKVIDLPADLRTKLGYAAASQPAATNSGAAAANWVAHQAAKLETPTVKELGQKLFPKNPKGPSIAQVDSKQLFLIIGAVVALFLCFSYCCSLICEKAGENPGVLIWLPVLQVFPLLRAAGMHRIWFVAYLVPVLNVVAQVVWSVKIVHARGKSGWVAFWLILPVTSPLAFFYLAFSEGAQPRQVARPVHRKLVSPDNGTEFFALG
jgi:hypothetical protein